MVWGEIRSNMIHVTFIMTALNFLIQESNFYDCTFMLVSLPKEFHTRVVKALLEFELSENFIQLMNK